MIEIVNIYKGKLQIYASIMENLQIYGTFHVKLQIYANNYRSMNKVTHLCIMPRKLKTPNASFQIYTQRTKKVTD